MRFVIALLTLVLSAAVADACHLRDRAAQRRADRRVAVVAVAPVVRVAPPAAVILPPKAPCPPGGCPLKK